jgi:hypothetical protein
LVLQSADEYVVVTAEPLITFLNVMASDDGRIEPRMAPKSQGKRVAPSIDLFSFAGEHLFYEAQMFVVTRAIQPRDQFETNLKVEDFALHLKNLIEFFYPSNPDPNDVLAADYVADWDSNRPAITSLLESARARAGRELHHLTAQRIAGKPAHKAWDFDGISKDLKGVISAFIALQPNIPHGTISELMEI